MFSIFKKAKKQGREGKEVILRIEGMHCTGCAMNIDGRLEEIDGVKESRTSYAKSETVLIVDEAGIDIKRIQREIDNLGYKNVVK